MTPENYDDGLVHTHAAWCSERGTPRHDARVTDTPPMSAMPDAIEHDDGLVHEHRWAMGERGDDTAG